MQSDTSLQGTESQEQASLEPLGVPLATPKKGKGKHRERDAIARQAMVQFLSSSHHWHPEVEIVRACRYALPNDSKDAAKLVHRQVTQNPKTFKYRKDGDQKVTLRTNLRDGVVQYDADI